jgi:invasion protein IalB
MRIGLLPLASILTCLAGPVLAQAPKPPAAAHPAAASTPKKLGVFEDWTAATHQEAGVTVCYAFTYAAHSMPPLTGRGEVVLTVTERPTARDDIALTAGFPYATGSAVSVQVDQTALDFYTAQPQPGRNAFARDGKAVIAAFGKGKEAVAHSPGPREAKVVDTFSLRGFSAAYAAISKACPAK